MEENKKILVLHNPTKAELKESFDAGFIPKGMKFLSVENVTVILRRESENELDSAEATWSVMLFR